jgi:hypothetical protein
MQVFMGVRVGVYMSVDMFLCKYVWVGVSACVNI